MCYILYLSSPEELQAHTVWSLGYRCYTSLHYKEYPIYAFPEMNLHGLVPNFHIYVSVSELYIATIGPPVFCRKIGGPIAGTYV